MTDLQLSVAPTCVYRFYDVQDRLLYVGVTDEPKDRWKYHEKNAQWWPLAVRRTVVWHDERRDALAEERAAILLEDPIYNVARPVVRPQRQRHRSHDGIVEDAELVALDLVSLDEAAAILGCSRQYAHRLAKTGVLLGARAGTVWVFRRVVVQELAAAKQQAVERLSGSPADQLVHA